MWWWASPVIPAKAGIQVLSGPLYPKLDSGFCP
jgi:hypothetical protein